MMDPGAYCREIESYLCRCNHGHLIRIVGPAFERVRGWAEAGVPLQVVTTGIDRRLARYRASGPRRRPSASSSARPTCWMPSANGAGRVGVAPAPGGAVDAADAADRAGRSGPRRPSLPRHVDRVLERVSNRLARDEMAADLRAALTRLAADLDALRPAARGARGAARRTLIDRLAEIDRVLLASVRGAAGPALDEVETDARAELASFRSRLDPDAYTRAVEASVDRLLRVRLRLPAVRFEE